ncbi:hypothetical protein CCR75_008234 [Bremia lactucae]|uniref:Phosphatidic acid phosphatase type 2/haloperoxidase domain-containing protein n=1 Tax=Bremia lactucae TaxID=4779 RepID=A0A976FIM4_BRELC|nr:hypothetical protein CCR75_008234 [Bremia lactucae]
MTTSFMYHVCDSIDRPLWLTEGQWHRLDNIGSIMSFVVWSIHLMDLQSPLKERYVQYFFFGMVLVFQEKNPWDEWNSVTPVASSFLLLLATFAIRRRMPSYNYQQFRRGLLLMALAVMCFVRGLNDDTDPFRVYHGSARHIYLFWPIACQSLLVSGGGKGYVSIPQVDEDEISADLEQPSQLPMSLTDKLFAYDLVWSTKLYQRFGRDPTPRLCWEVFSHTGDGFLWILTIPPLMGLLWAVGLIGPFEPATTLLLSALSSVITVDIIAIMLLKLIFRRQRPPFHQVDVRFVGPDQHSFPSGHSTRVWAIVAMLVYLAQNHPWILRQFFYGLSPSLLVTIVIIWGLVINFSRVALGRHYPTDVLAGATFGFLSWE